jgi:hypothetical protein
VARERLLQLLLRFGGFVLCLAFPTVLLPLDWMASTHQALGLGAFPRSVIVEYLARSIGLLYGLHGILLLIVAKDPVRYREIVNYLAFFNISFGLAVLIIDLKSGMPWFWTLWEGPVIATLGMVFAVLNRPAARERVDADRVAARGLQNAAHSRD